MLRDTLSNVLSMLKPQAYAAGGLDLGGAWSLRFDAHDGIKCYACLAGAGWIIAEGDAKPVLLEAGDCVLLPNGLTFILTKDPSLASVPFGHIPQDDWYGRIATVNGGGDTVMLAGHFSFSGAHTSHLLGVMPTIVRLRETSDKDGMRWLLQRMCTELSLMQPGNVLVAEHLAHLVLVQALRLYIAQGVGRQIGWLFALADQQLATAISAIHASPGERWTLPALASQAGMSRSRFAARFKAVTGVSPIDYLIRWRMLLANERLSLGIDSVAAISASLGYESESAFSTAFKRVIGCAPRTYGLRVRTQEYREAPLPLRYK
jgi:AraC-like DNA-binding protein